MAAPLLTLGLLPLLAMQSPWWEHYDLRERFVCGERLSVVLERNASQASLITGGSRATLFREESDAPGLRYQNESLRVILRGDELTLEQLPTRRVCLRTEEV
ncbi:MliC family protein [Synechococcus sp. CCY 9618]|uniref:MliC family protein n=1 Tax=Synechococcus sp. CCY 9618 TaxID=2815602 RepID=UPI001C21FB57|nr:MliC family protein [Synechococcus sp. CCY 9618]